LNCSNTCLQYKAPGKCIGLKYEGNVKYCSYCEVKVEYEGSHCPCCHTQLRCKPRAKKYKQKRERKTVA